MRPADPASFKPSAALQFVSDTADIAAESVLKLRVAKRLVVRVTDGKLMGITAFTVAVGIGTPGTDKPSVKGLNCCPDSI
jgi:hypothetical protein